MALKIYFPRPLTAIREFTSYGSSRIRPQIYRSSPYQGIDPRETGMKEPSG
jgi:hypothetical protein